jgi:hypothetical protein
MRSLIVKTGILAALLIAVLELLCLQQSAWWLGFGDRAAKEGRAGEALDAWRAAASWQAPINPWRDEALERLAAGPRPEALYRLRGAILESSLIPIENDGRLLAQASRRLADLRPDLPPALWTDVPAKFSLWKALAVLSLIALLLAGYALIRFSSKDAVKTPGIVLCLAVYWTTFLFILLGLYLAP